MRLALGACLVAMLWMFATAVTVAAPWCDGETAEAAGPDSAVQPDPLEVSLLTCSPGKAVYELYGHTALRVCNAATGEDVVFNYGIFDFSAPHFVWRFMLGHTDYVLGAVPYSFFAAAYAADGRGVEGQVLNLTAGEKQRLVASLAETYRKAAEEGWTYRYNFLYDNCTTRAIDEVAHCVEGRIEWPAPPGGKTFRSVLHEFSAGASPWNCFGQDLLLGAETDAPAGTRQLMFSPVYAAGFADKARIVASDGRSRPLVSRREVLVPAPALAAERFPLSPMAAAALLLALAVALSLGEAPQRSGPHVRRPAAGAARRGGVHRGDALLFLRTSGRGKQLAHTAAQPAAADISALETMARTPRPPLVVCPGGARATRRMHRGRSRQSATFPG